MVCVHENEPRCQPGPCFQMRWQTEPSNDKITCKVSGRIKGECEDSREATIKDLMIRRLGIVEAEAKMINRGRFKHFHNGASSAGQETKATCQLPATSNQQPASPFPPPLSNTPPTKGHARMNFSTKWSSNAFLSTIPTRHFSKDCRLQSQALKQDIIDAMPHTNYRSARHPIVSSYAGTSTLKTDTACHRMHRSQGPWISLRSWRVERPWRKLSSDAHMSSADPAKLSFLLLPSPFTIHCRYFVLRSSPSHISLSFFSRRVRLHS